MWRFIRTTETTLGPFLELDGRELDFGRGEEGSAGGNLRTAGLFTKVGSRGESDEAEMVDTPRETARILEVNFMIVLSV